MAHDRKKLRSFHLFAGAGGGILADLLLGHRVVGACEIEDYPRQVLLQRQRDGILPAFPIWDDITTLDGKQWRGHVDIIAGGFPCQDISSAGNGAGLDGERSGLWREMARVIDEVRPGYVLVENSPVLTSRGLGVVLGDLAAMGYNARWGVLGACDVGAPHKRDRIWILADNLSEDVEESKMVQPTGANGQPGRATCNVPQDIRSFKWRANKHSMVGNAYDMATWVVRSKAIGNGQVPQVAALAWQLLGGPIE